LEEQVGDKARKSELFEEFARVGKALGNGKRLELLDLLTQGERSVETLAAAAGLGLSTASAHLQALRQAGLVTTRRDGNRIHYDLAGPEEISLAYAAEVAWRAGIVVVAVIALDQLTKHTIATSNAANEGRSVFLGIKLVHVRNHGVAFGFLSGGGAIVLVFTLAALGALLLYFYLRPQRPWLWLPTGLLIGGAIGNLIDRLAPGDVVRIGETDLRFEP